MAVCCRHYPPTGQKAARSLGDHNNIVQQQHRKTGIIVIIVKIRKRHAQTDRHSRFA